MLPPSVLDRNDIGALAIISNFPRIISYTSGLGTTHPTTEFKSRSCRRKPTLGPITMRKKLFLVSNAPRDCSSQCFLLRDGADNAGILDDTQHCQET